MAKTRLPIRHLGYLSLCSAQHREGNIVRIDLGAARYRRLGVREREKPYRVCKRCLAVIVQRENRFKPARAQSRGHHG